jgi:hypothetical protein
MVRVPRFGWIVSVSLGFASFAGASALVAPPLGTEVCGEIDVASDLPDPNTVFANLPAPELCEKLCHRAEAACRASVRDSSSCVLRVIRFSARFARLACEAQFDDAEELACEEENDAFWLDQLPSARDERALRLNACGEWADVCRASSCD